MKHPQSLIENVRRLRTDGLSRKEIAAKNGITENQVVHILYHNKILLPRLSSDKKLVDTIRKLRKNEKLSTQEIAGRIKLSRKQVSYLLEKNRILISEKDRKRIIRRHRLWTSERIAHLKKLRGEGISIKDIASQIGMSYKAVAAISNRLGLRYTPEHRSRIWTKEKLSQLKELRGKGLSRADIASQMGMSYSAVSTASNRLGLRYTREQLSAILKSAHRPSKAERDIMRWREWRGEHLATVKDWSWKVGYIFGATKGTSKCDCLFDLHFGTLDYDLLSFVADILEDITGRKISRPRRFPYNDGCPKIKVRHRPLIRYLKLLDSIIWRRYSKSKPFPKWNQDRALGFLAGIWDAKGRVRYNLHTGKASLRLLVRRHYIAKFVVMLHNIASRGKYGLGVGGGAFIYKMGGGRRYSIVIRRGRSIQQFARVIGFRHPEKRKKLRNALRLIRAAQKEREEDSIW